MGVSRSFNAIKCWIHNLAAATLSHISQRKALGTGGKGGGVRRIKDYQGCYNPLRALLLRLVITRVVFEDFMQSCSWLGSEKMLRWLQIVLMENSGTLAISCMNNHFVLLSNRFAYT